MLQKSSDLLKKETEVLLKNTNDMAQQSSSSVRSLSRF